MINRVIKWVNIFSSPLRAIFVFGISAVIVFLITFALFPRKKTTIPTVIPLQHQIYTPQSGEIFSGILNRAAVSTQLNTKIVDVLKKIGFNFARLNLTDTFKFFYRNDTLVKIEYKKDYAIIYTFDNLETENISIAMQYKDIKKKIMLVKGEIRSSLYESMLNIGEGPQLIADYADVLAWEIDFFTETQNGDSFFVLVEKKFDDQNFIDYGQVLAVRYKGQIGDFLGYFYVDPTGYKDYYDYQGKSLRKAFLKSPLRYSHISSYFSRGRYHPILKIVRPHRGIDYTAPSGTPVSAIGHGTVTFAGWRGGYGRLVEIVHAQRFKSRYGHLRSFGKGIRSGLRVNQGQIVGYVGSTGMSTGPHLHFELLQNGAWVNPMKIIPPRADPVKQEYLAEFAKKRDSLNRFFYTTN